MKTLAFVLAAMSASAALAQPPPTAAAHAEQQRPIIVRGTHARYDPNEIVCRSLAETGSRLRTQRTCATRAQWSESLRQDRQAIERIQTQRTF